MENILKEMLKELQNEEIQEMVNYDIKNEWLTDILKYINKNVKKKLSKRETEFDAGKISEWEKMCCYQLARLKIDCDVSLRNITMYALAFPFVLEEKNSSSGEIMTRKIRLQAKGTSKYEICSDNEDGYKYRGDTMNSYSTTMNEFLRLYGDNSTNPTVLIINEGKRNKGKFMTNYSEWEECVLDNYPHFESRLSKPTEAFIRLNHTLGNFIPVPFRQENEEFNRPRGTGKTKDYWDLALLKIYNWYDAINKEKPEEADKYLKELMTSPENIKLCKEWLEGFTTDDGKPSWDIFVVSNYMQDFVNDGDAEGHFSMPKELWAGHFENNDLPKRNEDFNQFFTNASEWIEARGERIAISVKKNLGNDELVKKILDC
jgi:hypothetical protein